MKIFVGLAISYLIGSVPTAYIYGKISKGIDIRQHGSGNVGATNVFRVLGKKQGAIVLSLDILKGIVPVVVVSSALGLSSVMELILLAVAAVAGHNWTIFLKFKGGKGVATSLGVLIGLTVKIASIRPVLAVTLLAWCLVFLITGFVSAASLMAAVVLPLAMVATDQSLELVVMAVLFCLFIVIRHKPNIRRLLAGQEPRIKVFSLFKKP
jgi:glycerol-3-phosphate acyltransferase PlsY